MREKSKRVREGESERERARESERERDEDKREESGVSSSFKLCRFGDYFTQIILFPQFCHWKTLYTTP